MNYITNQNNQIIAADDSLLALLHIADIEELAKQVILGNIHFLPQDGGNLDIQIEAQMLTFKSTSSMLSSMVGDLKLISLEHVAEEEKLISIIDDTSLEEAQDAKNEVDESLIFIKEDEAPITLTTPDEPKAEDSQDEANDEIGFLKETDNALFDLTVPQIAEETIDEIAVETTGFQLDEPIAEDSTSDDSKEPKLDMSPIMIDVAKISQDIGISPEDYKAFLDEYIDTAISLEDDMRSTDSLKRSEATDSLIQLAEVLQLPLLNDIISTLDTTAPQKVQEETLESFYGVLARLVAIHEPLAAVEPSKEKEELFLEEIQPAPDPSLVSGSKGFGSIDLDDIQPIPFAFQLEAAANDLSLPKELIEEFVHDFIDQAHLETNKMLQAYEEGDLDTIQKIGHMLKGASSNLRISDLSDTLYEIQFCEDSSQLEDLIKRYWGQFIAFEQQINMISK